MDYHYHYHISLLSTCLIILNLITIVCHYCYHLLSLPLIQAAAWPAENGYARMATHGTAWQGTARSLTAQHGHSRNGTVWLLTEWRGMGHSQRTHQLIMDLV